MATAQSPDAMNVGQGSIDRLAERVARDHRETQQVAVRWSRLGVILPVVSAIAAAIAGGVTSISDLDGGWRAFVIIVSFVGTALSAGIAALRAPERAEGARRRVAELESVQRWIPAITEGIEHSGGPSELELMRRYHLLLARIDEINGVVNPWKGNPPWVPSS
ncbi:hypothetical protein JOF56_003744 [Kibdelosporangium banguiense]|uniref:SLATT domain-containing protein n=1 Tax=Kibdelosporangium banguiense TaxID=1365924 RepID=A0ABS4TG58_9PSEU|nr:hypothetical protein [Kibdelosporangium banguiense]MBP2323359.1 hypothetical protein [Kibdelosporangium banguiense]